MLGRGRREEVPTSSELAPCHISLTHSTDAFCLARLCLKKSFTQGQCSLTQGKGRVQNSHGSRYKLIQEMKRQKWLAPAGPSSVLISQHADKAMGWGVVPADEQICWFMYHCVFSFLSVGWVMGASYFYQQQMLLDFCESVFIRIYLIVNLVSILSMCFVPSSFIYSLSEMPKPFTHFKIGQMVHLNCFIGVLCIGYLQVLCHLYILQIFSSILWLAFLKKLCLLMCRF